MDAYNLAIVISPNLVSSSNPMLDVSMCAVSGSSVTDAVPGNTTLGTVIRLCIQRYYEIFDEVLDRSEAILPRDTEDLSAGLPEGHETRLLHDDEDGDEDIDDAMLVMPIGPSASNSSNAQASHTRSITTPPNRSNSVPSTVWTAKTGEGTVSVPYQPRTRTPKSTAGRAATRSVQSANKSTGSGLAYASQSKARSVINIEKATGVNGGTTSRKGSISIGRGSSGKSAGAGVEALGITAEGFFMPPSSAPPVPSPPSAYKRR
jgi:Rho GTPase-activating protein 1